MIVYVHSSKLGPSEGTYVGTDIAQPGLAATRIRRIIYHAGNQPQLVSTLPSASLVFPTISS